MDYEQAARWESAQKEAPLDAYLMAKGILAHNLLIERGEEPIDSDGNPLYVSFIPDVDAYVTSCYGTEPNILAAIAAAHKNTLEGGN